MNRLAWAWMPANRRRYSPMRKTADGQLIFHPSTDDIEAQLDRDQLAGRLKPEWIPPGFGHVR